MTTTDINIFYNDLVLTDAWTVDVVKALKDGKISDFSTLPEDHLGEDTVSFLRNDGWLTDEYERTKMEECSGKTADALVQAIKAEAHCFIFCASAKMFAEQNGFFDSAEFKDRILTNFKNSAERLNCLTLFMDEHEYDTTGNAVVNFIDTAHNTYQARYLRDFANGADYGHAHNFLKENAAWGYMKAVDAYNQSIALQASIAVLRLTQEPNILNAAECANSLEDERKKAYIMCNMAELTKSDIAAPLNDLATYHSRKSQTLAVSKIIPVLGH